MNYSGTLKSAVQDLPRKMKALALFVPPIPHTGSILFPVALFLCWSGTWSSSFFRYLKVAWELRLHDWWNHCHLKFLIFLSQCNYPMLWTCVHAMFAHLSGFWCVILPLPGMRFSLGPLSLSIWWTTHPLRPFQILPPIWILSTCKFGAVLSPYILSKCSNLLYLKLMCLILIITTLAFSILGLVLSALPFCIFLFSVLHPYSLESLLLKVYLDF